MKSIITKKALFAIASAVAATCLCVATKAQTVSSGQHAFGQSEVEPAFDDSNGNAIYLKSPLKNPFPSEANPRATAPMYTVVYPLSSTVPADQLNCQPTNCDHLNVLPFADSDYGALPGSDQACMDFNGGSSCSPVKGHDHLVGVASTGGDFNQAWHVELVIFSSTAFLDGSINTRITTLSQLLALEQSGDVFIVDTPITFNCSVTSEETYDRGTSVVIPYP